MTELPDPEPWHPGEMQLKRRAGVDEKQIALGAKVIRSFMPDQHRAFFERLTMIVIATTDDAGSLRASLLFGMPNFIRSPDEHTLVIEASCDREDPVFNTLKLGQPVALLGIDFETRRRNRMNGEIRSQNSACIEIAVRQSFGNCPKYIQKRQRVFNPAYGDIGVKQIERLDKPLQYFLQQADLLFIASKYIDDKQDDSRGIDVSHRGGRPGFLEVDEQGRLLMPDFAGNNFFNTLGNIELDPEVALLIPDYDNGHLLHLNCRAEILWRDEHPQLCRDYERMLRFTIERGRIVHNRMPFLWRNIDH